MNTFHTDFKKDKTAFTIASLTDESDQREYWKSKSPLERLQAIEFTRQIYYGYDPSTARLQRILSVSELQRG